MDQAHLHLLLNHMPIAGVIIGLLTLIGGLLIKNKTVKRTALAIFVISALCAIPSFLTGEGAEDIVENVAGIEKDYIETHEDIGGIYIWVISALGLLSLLTLYLELKTQRNTGVLYIIILIAAIATAAISKQLGTSGGEIRHTEIRTGAAQIPLPENASGEHEDDD